MQLNPFLSSDKQLLVVSHDAGGAEVLSSLVKNIESRKKYILKGPAINIFRQKLGNILIEESSDSLFLESDLVLCSTSWQSDLEFDALKTAKKLARPSLSYLDHWVNYKERFERSGVVHLPDGILVGDDYALKLASQVFKSVPISLIPNPYIEEIKKKLNLQFSVESNFSRILYICEPIKEHALLRFGSERYWGYVEEDALRYFIENLNKITNKVQSITIRPHPSEKMDKYDWAIREFDLPITIGGKLPLLDEISQSDIIVGCQSMALVIGLLANKKVFSCLPTKDAKFNLPHSEIIQLRDLVKGT